MQAEKKQIKTVQGVVVSRSGDKSIRIVIDYRIKHPVYCKFMNRRTKFGVSATPIATLKSTNTIPMLKMIFDLSFMTLLS